MRRDIEDAGPDPMERTAMMRNTRARRPFSSLLTVFRAVTVRAGFLVGRLLPTRRVVVLATSHADQLGGNLAAIRDEAARRTPPLPTRALAYRARAGTLGVLAQAWHGARAGYELARARVVVVDDYFFPIYAVARRPGTTVVQVWHACGAFKKFGYSLRDKTFGATAEDVDRVPIHTGYDLCLVSSRAAIPAYAEAFARPPDVFVSEIGIPRTDALTNPQRREAVASAVRSRYGIDAQKRVVLYAPTFRGTFITRARHPVDLDLDRLRAAIGDDHVVLLRRHPFVRAQLPMSQSLATFVVDASDHPDINELLLASDVLVTDYSSAIFEFALLRRPIGFFAPDHVEYELERGFYLDFPADLPGPLFEDTDSLAAWLRTGTFDVRTVEQFARRWFDVADGRSAARFVDLVVTPALAGRRVTASAVRDAAAHSGSSRVSGSSGHGTRLEA